MVITCIFRDLGEGWPGDSGEGPTVTQENTGKCLHPGGKRVSGGGWVGVGGGWKLSATPSPIRLCFLGDRGHHSPPWCWGLAEVSACLPCV